MTSIINDRNTRQEILQARTEKQTAKIWEIYLRQRKGQRKNGKKHPQKNQHDEHEVEKQRG